MRHHTSQVFVQLSTGHDTWNNYIILLIAKLLPPQILSHPQCHVKCTHTNIDKNMYLQYEVTCSGVLKLTVSVPLPLLFFVHLLHVAQS